MKAIKHKYVELELYKQILDNVVNFCVDIVVKHNGRYVLVTRSQNPMKGVPWVVGGRVHQRETAEYAAIRKLKEEIGIFNPINLRPIGYYEGVFDSNSYKDNTTYHTFSLVFETEIDSIEDIKLDDTSQSWGLYDHLPEKFKLIRIFGE